MMNTQLALSKRRGQVVRREGDGILWRAAHLYSLALQAQANVGRTDGDAVTVLPLARRPAECREVVLDGQVRQILPGLPPFLNRNQIKAALGIYEGRTLLVSEAGAWRQVTAEEPIKVNGREFSSVPQYNRD